MRGSFSNSPPLRAHPVHQESMVELPVKVAGFTPLTTIDFPGYLACVLFLQGCPWRCFYCHNTHLQRQEESKVLKREVKSEGMGGRSRDKNREKREESRQEGFVSPWSFLLSRRNLLEGVVFSGGEPTAQKGLSEAIRLVQGLGFRVGLHTAGPFPERLEEVLSLVDWVGMDYKAPFSQYDAVTGVPGSGVLAKQSAEMLLRSKVPYEFRTTVDPRLHTLENIKEGAQELHAMGAKHYRLQRCRDGEGHPLEVDSMVYLLGEKLTSSMEALFETFFVR